MATLPFEDLPPKEWRRPVRDADGEPKLPPEDPMNAAFIGIMFCKALRNPVEYQTALTQLVTPESLNDWGDFAAAGELLESIPEVGFGTLTNQAYGAPDVRYFKILSGVGDAYMVVDEQPVMAAALLTMIWRPEHGRWMVHAMGDSLLPEHLPRSAPGQTPDGVNQ